MMSKGNHIISENLQRASPSYDPGRARRVIKAGRQGLLPAMVETWRYRELFLFLVWRDISVKYKQTILGVLWVILQPLLAMIVFTLVFNKMAKIPSDNIPYPIFVLAGIICWNFFAGSLSRAGESLVGNANLITKIYFPRVIIPGAAALANLADFAISLLVLAGMMVYYKFVPGAEILALPALTLLILLLSMSVGMFSAAANVRFRDVKFVFEYAVRIWMFVTPVVYPYSLIPEKYRSLAMINPMVGVVEAFRWSLLGRPFPATPLLVSCLLTLAAFLIAQEYFRRVERTFADVV